MVLTADAPTLRKLEIAKQVYLEGTRQRAKSSQVSRLLAVIAYDHAIESTLKVALRHLANKLHKGDFPQLVSAVEAAMTHYRLGDLPRAADIQYVRNVRNAAQHEGRLPTPEEEEDCHLNSRTFLDEFLGAVWGYSLDRLRLSQLILDEECKAKLDEAESRLAAEDFIGAAHLAAVGLELAFYRVRNALVGRGEHWMRGILIEDSFGRPKASRDLTQSIERTQQTVLYLALGLDYSEYLRFQAVAGSATPMLSGDFPVHGGKETVDRAEAEQALAYASEAISQIESRVGSIAKPFGSDFWF